MSTSEIGGDSTEKINPSELDKTKNLGAAQFKTSTLSAEEIIPDLLRRTHESEKYIVDCKIGQGGMGAIYRVFDQDIKRTSVLKVVLPGVLEDALLFHRFIEEAQITGQLEHPNIIPVHELGVLGEDKLYFSMKYVQGEALGFILKKVRDGDPAYVERYTRYTLLTIFRKVCDAVGYAHSKKIVHRDLKPDNIMIGEYGEALVMDWGLARPMDRHDESKAGDADDHDEFDDDDALKTRYGVVKGTPAYMSPEQAKGLVSEIDHRSDIFLLGATLYAIVTFNVPYTGTDIYEILANAENANFVPPGIRAPERQIPDELCRIIEKAMAYERQDRYQTVDELSEDIDKLMAGDLGSVRKLFEAGELIMKEGDPGYEAYVILSGKVEVTKTVRGKSIKLISLGQGDVIGEMALILEAPRTASVRAVEHTELVVINEETMNQGLGRLPPWMGKVVDSLAERLRAANANVHPLMNGDCTYHVMSQLRLVYNYWAQPVKDTDENSIVMGIDNEQVIREIATNLSLTKERVATVVSLLIESNLLRVCGTDHVYIPNYALFCDFTDFSRKQFGLESSFDHQNHTSFLAGDHDFVVRHHRDSSPSGRIETMTRIDPTPAVDLIGCETREEKLERFDLILTHLRDELLTTGTQNANNESSQSTES